MDLPVIVIDTETTGLPEHPDAVAIEIALVLLMPDGSKPFALSSLLRPEDPNEIVWTHTHVRETMTIHGITPAHVALAPVAKRVDDLLDYTRRYAVGCYGQQWPCEDLAWTSWRTEFEAEMFRRSLPKVAGWQTAPCIWELARESFRPEDLAKPHYPSIKTTAHALGLQADRNTHRALPDALLAADVLYALIHRDSTQPLEVS